MANEGTDQGRALIEVAGGVAIVVGIALLGNGVALHLMGSRGAPVALMAVGLVLVAAGMVAEGRHVERMLRSPSFPMTLIVVAAGLLGLVALGLLNYLNVRHYRRVDLTDRGIYTLDSQSVNILKSVDKPLRIISAMVPNPNPRSGIEQFNNLVRQRADEMLKEYASHSRHIEYTPIDFYADPEARTKLEDQYGVDILRDAVVFVYDTGDKKPKTKAIEFSELIEQRPAFMEAEPQFKGEEVFTSALQGLIEGKTTKVFFVIGHGEKDIDEFDEGGLSTLAEAVRNDNCDVRTCELPEIPDDCDILVVAGPKKPFLPAEIDAIRKYLNEGRKGLIALLDPIVGDVAPSGLEELAREQGIEVKTSETIVDVSRLEILPGLMGAAPSVTIATTEYPKGRAGMWPADHPITRDMRNLRTAYYMACPVSVPMQPGPRGPQGDPYNVELVQTSSRAVGVPDFDPATMDRIDLDREGGSRGPFGLAVARGKWMEQEPPMPMGMAPQGKMAVFGDSDFVSNMLLRQGATGNLTLFRNTVAWVAGKEYKIGIPPKPIQQDRRFDLTDRKKTLARWATVVVPPFHVLLIGVVVWWIRRR